jgi:hypothetical protein
MSIQKTNSSIPNNKLLLHNESSKRYREHLSNVSKKEININNNLKEETLGKKHTETNEGN